MGRKFGVARFRRGSCGLTVLKSPTVHAPEARENPFPGTNQLKVKMNTHVRNRTPINQNEHPMLYSAHSSRRT